MDSALLDRYSRNIILREIGGLGQKRLLASSVLIVGAGGLGCPILMYLAASGVGEIGVIDFDTVSLSNLQRQIIFSTDDIGNHKVDLVKSRLNQLNPNIKITPYTKLLSEDNAYEIIRKYDLIVDGSDNFSTRYLVNKVCFVSEKPLLSGAISQWDGQISLYNPNKGLACYECVFPEKSNTNSTLSCSENGVFGPLAGIVGALMAAEAMKFITRVDKVLEDEIILYDALCGVMRRYKTHARKDCNVCGKN
jgi:molybdopterin/thiamine biosynthesis adenylyltransferase